MARRKKQKQRKTNSSKWISLYGAFEYKLGSKTATVRHYNIRRATLAKREKVAAELEKFGIRTISSDGNTCSVRKFLRLNK